MAQYKHTDINKSKTSFMKQSLFSQNEIRLIVSILFHSLKFVFMLVTIH